MARPRPPRRRRSVRPGYDDPETLDRLRAELDARLARLGWSMRVTAAADRARGVGVGPGPWSRAGEAERQALSRAWILAGRAAPDGLPAASYPPGDPRAEGASPPT